MYKVVNIISHNTVHTASTLAEARQWIDGLSNCDLDAIADSNAVVLVIFFGKHNARLVPSEAEFYFNCEEECWERV